MARKKTGILDYRPEIEYERPRVMGDPKIEVRLEDEPTEEERQQKQTYQQLLDDALQADQELRELREEIDRQLEALSIPVDAAERPRLAEAVRRLGNDDTNSITYEVFDRAVRIMNNAFLAQYGFEPSQLLFTEPGPDGYRVPDVRFPDDMSCRDVAELNLMDMQLPAETRTLESIIEDRQRVTRFSLLKILWRMLLGFVYQFMAGLIKKTKLEKVPIAGRVVKRIRRKLEKKARRMFEWVQKGNVFKWDGGEEFDDPDLSGLMEGEVTQSGNQAIDCIQAATEVINYATHWALHTPSTESAENNSVNPHAIPLRLMLERQQSLHEATKFNLDIIIPQTEEFQEKRNQLHENTMREPSMANRYFNRSIINIRKGK